MTLPPAESSRSDSLDYGVVGAGMGGTLMAILLARAGRRVELFEGRPDPRRGGLKAGKSINLALSRRGLDALAQADLKEAILGMAVPMRGRMIHSRRGRTTFQPYSAGCRHAIQSVSRAALNLSLLNAAEEAGVRIRFQMKCRDVRPEDGVISLENLRSGARENVRVATIIGADGAHSVVRRRLLRSDGFEFHQSYLAHGYKELTLPAAAGGRFAMEPHALHIWPRGESMMIALPNRDGSFTCTLFWPRQGPASFAALKTGREVTSFFRRTFPDAVGLLPNLEEEYFSHEEGSLVTIRCRPWHHGPTVVLLGDACHAVVPFYGQGANAAF
ncbi:MAG: FAD-dependent oxidoreductase, partial [Acidobacteriota bacterium]